MILIALFLNLFTSVNEPDIIDGYQSDISVFPGDSVNLFLNASFSSDRYTVRLYDLSGNIVLKYKTSVFAQAQLALKPYQSGFNYKRTCRVAIPNVASGVYLWENKIPIVVKSRTAKITILYPSNTANAYCNSGGKSLYGFNSSEKVGSQVVSFQRPVGLENYSEAFLRWMHRSNLSDVGYIADMDMDDFNSISKSKLLIVPGHSEYWTAQARRNFDRFVQSGSNAMVLSGNTMWWQVRYNKSKTRLICYRDGKLDPAKSETLKTISWSDPSLQYPITASIGVDFANAGYGVKFSDNGWDGFKIIADSPLLEGTTVKKGDIIKCPGDELDGAPIVSFLDGIPIVDEQALSFFRIEIIGFDLVQRGGKPGIATWVVFKSTRSSGIVINTGSTDWCSSKGIGSNRDIQIVTATMMRKIMNDENVFSTPISSNEVAN